MDAECCRLVARCAALTLVSGLYLPHRCPVLVLSRQTTTKRAPMETEAPTDARRWQDQSELKNNQESS
eukprot:364425-Amphidinium_carterae.2